MAVLFSKVHITANEENVVFLIPGIPREYEDLEDWPLFGNYLMDVENNTEVFVCVKAFLYGVGETVRASFYDLVCLTDQMRLDPDFLEKHCDNIDALTFSFVWAPEELFGLKEMEY